MLLKYKSPDLIAEEIVGSMLPVYSESVRHKTETWEKARELRRWIAANPGCAAADMPENCRSYLSFLIKKRLVTWKGNDRKYHVVTLDQRIKELEKRDY